MSSGSEDGRSRAERLRRWVDNWNAVGPILEQERMARLARMTDEEARATTLALFTLWRRPDRDNGGAELVTQQRWFMKAARATRAP